MVLWVEAVIVACSTHEDWHKRPRERSPTENTTGSIITDYNDTDPTYPIACWGDVNPSTGAPGGTITTKGSGSTDTSCDMSRPDGADEQIAALNADRRDTGTPTGATVGGHASLIWGHGDITLGKTVNPATGDAGAPTSTNSDGQPVINPGFSSQFTTTQYIVVRNGFSDPTSASDATWPTLAWESAGLRAAFGPTGYTCTSETAEADEVSYGVGLLGINCGALTAGD